MAQAGAAVGQGRARGGGELPLVAGGPEAEGAAADGRTVAVEGDEVPAAEIVAVVPLVAIAGGAGGGARPVEVVEVAAGAIALVLVVAGHGPALRAQEAPGQAVDRVVLGELPRLVLVVAEGKHEVGGQRL